MNLKLLVAIFAMVMTTSGCVVHFPLADNVPSLNNNESSSVGNMSVAPTEPNTRDPVKGNSSDTPD